MFGVSCQGQWGAIFVREPGAPPRGGRGVQPRGCSESPARPVGGHLLQRTGRTGPGGTGSPAQGVFGASCKANGGPSSLENRAHRPGGDGESCPGGVRSLLQGQWGAIFFREPGAPARGGRGVLPRGCSESPARPMGGHLLQRTGRTGLGGTGSPAQGVVGVSCQASGGPSSSENRAHRPGGDGESCPGGVRSLLPGPVGGHLRQRTGRTGPGGTGSPAQGVFGASCQRQWGTIFFREPGAPAWGGRGVLPRGCSESPARPMGGHLLQRTGRTGPGGTGSPAQGVFGVSCQANGGATSCREPGAPAWGGRGVLPRGCSEPPARANGGPSSSENRAHRPGGDGESCPGGVRSLLPGQWGAIFFREPGAPARGGRGVLPRGCSEPPARASGGPSSSENRAHRPGGDGEPSPGGVRSLLQGQWGAIFFREPGAPAWGGRGVLPRGCSESPARPVGGHLLQRTGRTGPGGTGSPAQGVFGVSCQANGGATSCREPGAPAWGERGVLPRGCSEPPARANGGPSSSENRAHRPGGDGESCPGGVRSLLQGQWGASIFGEPGAPAWGGRGVLPRGCSEPPARPVGGQHLRRTGRTGLGGTGSPAQGVFGASGRARGYSLLHLSSSRQVSRQYRGS